MIYDLLFLLALCTSLSQLTKISLYTLTNKNSESMLARHVKKMSVRRKGLGIFALLQRKRFQPLNRKAHFLREEQPYYERIASTGSNLDAE